MDFPLDQQGWHYKNPPSSIQSRWKLKSIDLNIVVDIHMLMEQYLPPSYLCTFMGESWFSTIWEGYSVVICQRRKVFGVSSHFLSKYHSDSVLPQNGYWQHSTTMSVPQTVCQKQECILKENYLGLVPCHYQPNKVNVLCPVGVVENASLNKIPWGRWCVGRIMDIWWRRVRLFVKENLSWTLLPDNSELIGTMEGITGKCCGR